MKTHCHKPHNLQSKRYKEVVELVNKAGLTLLDTGLTAGNHVYLLCKAEHGGKRKFFASNTASDVRADLNVLSELRRFSRDTPHAQA